MVAIVIRTRCDSHLATEVFNFFLALSYHQNRRERDILKNLSGYFMPKRQPQGGHKSFYYFPFFTHFLHSSLAYLLLFLLTFIYSTSERESNFLLTFFIFCFKANGIYFNAKDGWMDK